MNDQKDQVAEMIDNRNYYDGPIARVDYDILPEHMRHSTRGYVEKGWEPGSFLAAVLQNDLIQAFAHADIWNRAAMAQWAQWLMYLPRVMYGSKEKVAIWRAFRRAVTEEGDDG